MDGSRHAPQRRIYEACHNLLSKVEKKNGCSKSLLIAPHGLCRDNVLLEETVALTEVVSCAPDRIRHSSWAVTYLSSLRHCP